jgi:hypothetical protein
VPPSEQQSEPSSKGASRTIRCAKCRASNSVSRNTCESCGAHLFVVCRTCGHGNPRIDSRCSACGESLHRSAVSKMIKKANERRTKFPLWQIALLVVVIPVAFKIIMLVINSMSNTPPPAE